MSDKFEQTIGEMVRDGLLMAASRTYGEQYIEPFIRQRYGFDKASGGDHDAVDRNGLRYEVKACKVLATSVNRAGSRNLLDRVKYELTNNPLNRVLPFSDALGANYDANVQNVKRDHFDILIYVLLFEDCVKIFWADRDTIKKGVLPNWSDKHGRYDAEGKSGQFPISRRNISWHLQNNLKETVSYEDVAEILTQIKD